jgi:hypothetical protein
MARESWIFGTKRIVGRDYVHRPFKHFLYDLPYRLLEVIHAFCKTMDGCGVSLLGRLSL